MKIKDSNLTINVLSLARSISFYESIGLKLENRWGEHYAKLTAPGLSIGLHPTRAENLKGNSGNTSIGFTCENFEEVKDHLKKLSITVKERHEEGGEFLHFEDPDGTAIYFIKPKW